MSRVIIRVELIGGAALENYENLHQFMYTQNWFTHISAGTTSGFVTKKLPSATYTGFSDYTASDVATALTDAIRERIWPRASVLVMLVTDSWAIRGDEVP